MSKQPYRRATLYVLRLFPTYGGYPEGFDRIEAREVYHGTLEVPLGTVGHNACESAVFVEFIKRGGAKGAAHYSVW